MTTILKYPGGKWRIADWIIAHLPAHKVYCEPYFGSGGVFFNKQPSYIETINDISGDIVNLFKVVRERPSELAAALALTPWARDEYRACNDPATDEVERARRTLVRHHQSYGTSNANKNTWRNSQTFNSPRCAAQWKDLPEAVFEICGRLKDAQIENVDALTLIERYNDPKTLLYLDPPYLQSLRKRNLYKCEMTDKQHIELLELIQQSKSKVCLSAYDNELYNEYLKDWFTAEKKTTAQAGKHRTEKIYMNYQPDLLSFIGGGGQWAMSVKDWNGNANSIWKTIAATNHSSEAREKDDYYATDPKAIDKLLQVEWLSGRIWECACGAGHLSERLTENGHYVYSSDIVDRGYKRHTQTRDFLQATEAPFVGSFDIVTNPPYKYAKEFVLKALELLPLRSKCCMFLKLTFLEGKARYKDLFSKYPPQKIYVFSERMQCAKNGDFEKLEASGGGAVAYGWFIWKKGFKGKTKIYWI